MSMDTNLPGRVRNTNLPKSNGLLPLFEAVINSIHSIDDANKIEPRLAYIKIEIIRATELDLQLPAGEIRAFKVVDNGVGFTDNNMKSFMTLDSEYKRDRGCRGIGRLMWLKAFDDVKIFSIFRDDLGNMMSRKFSFNLKNELNTITPEPYSATNIETSILLDGFYSKYSENNTLPKKIDSIANALLEHCLWYFIAPGGAPKITIQDGASVVNLLEVYENYMMSATPESMKVGDYEFELTHVRLNTHSSNSNVVAYCAGRRLVEEFQINGKIAGLHGRIKSNVDELDFIYACYVSSSYLDDNVRPERTGFDIDDKIDGMLPKNELAFSTIKTEVLSRIIKYLDPFLQESKELGKARIKSFVDTKAPRYRPILTKIDDKKLYIDPKISDKDLDVYLHKELFEIESNLLKSGHDLMMLPDSIDQDVYKNRLEQYLQDANDIKKSDLANYVFHRKVIIDLLAKALELQNTGKYVKEDIIHQLIMPMRKDSNGILFDDCNLWLVDERLAFHHYLASDKTLSSIPITGSIEAKEPDLCSLKIYNNPMLVSEGNKMPLASITIIEIKRPMRNDIKAGEDKDPIDQALGYLDRIREGKVTTDAGRPIINSENTPGFCYIICDLTDSVKKRCNLYSATLTHDGLGYFFYNKNYNAYVEVISFDGLINSAKERNRAFFDKLGLPVN